MNKEIYDNIKELLKMACSLVKKEYGNNDVEFEIFQESELYKRGQITPLDIAKFYNDNWTGNEVYIHVPDSKQIIDNLNNYPLIIAYDKKFHNILGVSTLKYDEITKDHIDPFFPEIGSKAFEMTGILTGMQNKIFGYNGIGVKIYEIEIIASFLYNLMYDNVRLVCEADCRNKNSIFALKKAADNVKSILKLEEKGTELLTSAIAYYITIKKDETLFESPIIVMEVNLEPTKTTEPKTTIIEFEKKENLNVYSSLLWTVTDKLVVDKNYSPVTNVAYDLGGLDVIYTKLDPIANQLKNFPAIYTNGTDLGENRRPLTHLEVERQYNDAVLENEEPAPVLLKIS